MHRGPEVGNVFVAPGATGSPCVGREVSRRVRAEDKGSPLIPVDGGKGVVWTLVLWAIAPKAKQLRRR